jgi:hypothetical protein
MQLNIKKRTCVLITTFGIAAVCSVYGCFTSKKVADKTGAQLWAENCQKCHNTPSPSTFSHEQWETVGMHMQTRALITAVERDKIVAFLKQ